MCIDNRDNCKTRVSGGAWEYVMANYNDTIASSGFVTMPNAKYYNKYTVSDVNTACNGSECLSHSLSETIGWYNDYRAMVSEEYPWLSRGGVYLSPDNGAGIFYFYADVYRIGIVENEGSFRLVATIR